MDRTEQSESGDAIERLAPREVECLHGVAQHKRTAQIAHELNLKPKTVDAYIANAFKKLGVADRDSAARLLIEHERRLGGKSPSDSSGVERELGPAATSWMARLPWPFPTSRRPINDLTLPQLLIAILIAATFMMGVAAIYLLSIALLSDQI